LLTLAKKLQAKANDNDAFTHIGQSRLVCKSVVAGRSILGRPILDPKREPVHRQLLE
jgi:hypothetical protein